MQVKPVRYQDQGCPHFMTFSCYRRMPLLDTLTAKETFEAELDRVRAWYGRYITGYVLMPELVHLLLGEPERSKLSVAIQMLKQITSQKLRAKHLPRFWKCPTQAKIRLEWATRDPKERREGTRYLVFPVNKSRRKIQRRARLQARQPQLR